MAIRFWKKNRTEGSWKVGFRSPDFIPQWLQNVAKTFPDGAKMVQTQTKTIQKSAEVAREPSHKWLWRAPDLTSKRTQRHSPSQNSYLRGSIKRNQSLRKPRRTCMDVQSTLKSNWICQTRSMEYPNTAPKSWIDWFASHFEAGKWNRRRLTPFLQRFSIRFETKVLSTTEPKLRTY